MRGELNGTSPESPQERVEEAGVGGADEEAPPQEEVARQRYSLCTNICVSPMLILLLVADTLKPIFGVPTDKEYDPINFIPLILDYRVLIAILSFNVACVGSIMTVLYCADVNHQYHTKYDNIHLVVRDTFARIRPYISMADQRGIRECRGSKSVGQLFMRGVRLDDRGTWTNQNRHSLRLATVICNILAVQIAGYKASLFSTAHSEEGWLVTVHFQMAWVLFAIYLLIIFLCCWMLSKMWRAKTGLKWDPVRIVDILALFHGSNILDDFKELELQPDRSAYDLLKYKTYRLGYWEKGVDKEIWYGIGRINRGSATASPQVHSLVIDHNRTNDSTESTQPLDGYPPVPNEDTHPADVSEPSRSNSPKASFTERRDGQHHQPSGHELHYDCDRYPWSRNSLFSPWTVFFWAPFVLGSLGLCIYTMATDRVRKGFIIATHTLFTNTSITGIGPGQFTYNITTGGGDIIIANFDPGNDLLWALFIFRTILVIMSSYMAITWFGWVDESMRFSQPFKNMHDKFTSAEDSLLLDYLWGIPGWTTVNALMHGHYAVAWYSFITFFSPSFPILVGGLFTITNTGKRIYFTISPEVFYLVFAYFVVYTVSVPLAWPLTNRRLLRYHDSIADYVSLFYNSYLLHDPKSQLDISAPHATKRHLESRVFLEEKKYSVGIYQGVDDKCHLDWMLLSCPEKMKEMRRNSM
ncbi:uncharacterized protein PAC_10131 [Phialocephala subalpina]|uniref:Uncharacterized protein n=1 Tax=Phialocephala subalpina TaxID=576137 RepID=A0A1L7X5F0_9HELO|nr:uncharacterized protein PAC_10131 [Phialocephala subalpina]